MLDANKLQQAVDQAYTQFHSLNGGQNADYIPFLANVPYLVNWQQWLL